MRKLAALVFGHFRCAARPLQDVARPSAPRCRVKYGCHSVKYSLTTLLLLGVVAPKQKRNQSRRAVAACFFSSANSCRRNLNGTGMVNRVRRQTGPIEMGVLHSKPAVMPRHGRVIATNPPFSLTGTTGATRENSGGSETKVCLRPQSPPPNPRNLRTGFLDSGGE